MKILMCTPRMGIGGAETHILTLSSALVRRGHEVTVASAGGLLVSRLEAAGVSHIVLPLDRKAPLCMARSLRGLRRAAKGCDVVHAHGRYPAFLCGILSKKPDFPAFVTTAHGVTSPREPQRTLSRWGEGVLSVSDTVTAYLKKQHGVPAEAIRFLPNGIRVSDRAEACAAPASDVCRIAAAGRLEKDTAGQFLLLLSLFDALLAAGTRAQLCLFGDGRCAEKIRSAAERINRKFPGSVRLPGPAADVGRALREYRADLFVGQSRAALEAMAEGIPTLLWSEVGCAGALSPANAERLFRENYMPDSLTGDAPSDALLPELHRFCGDTSLREGAASFAQDFVRKHNSLDTIAEQTEDFYSHILVKHRPGVVLCGYFGAGNLGDEATLRAVTEQIRSTCGEIPNYVVTRAPKKVPVGCTGIRRTDFRGIRRAFRASRVFILCGGSLLQNSTSNRSLWYYTALFRAAKKAGLRTQIWGGGIGPLHGKRAEKRAQSVLSVCDAAGLRDAQSLTYAGLYARYPYHSADAVLSVRPPSQSPTESGFFAVCPRALPKRKDTKRLLSALAEAAAQMRKETGAPPLYLALSPADRVLCERLAAVTPGEIFAPGTAEEAAARLSGARFTVSVRLHGAVLSLCAGTPAVCLSYDPKVAAFAAEAGLPSLPADAFRATDLIAVADVLPSRADVRNTAARLGGRIAADREAFAALWTNAQKR